MYYFEKELLLLSNVILVICMLLCRHILLINFKKHINFLIFKIFKILNKNYCTQFSGFSLLQLLLYIYSYFIPYLVNFL